MTDCDVLPPYVTASAACSTQALCSKHADVLRCRVVIDNRTGRTRGFAFVRVATPEGATRVIEHLNGYRHSLGGVPKRLKVCWLCWVARALRVTARRPLHRG